MCVYINNDNNNTKWKKLPNPVVTT